MAEKRVTLKDIAARDGSHVTTVSLALRNHRKLPLSTRERIQALAESMGYTPDPALRALVAYRRGSAEKRNVETLAYVTNWTSEWGWQKDSAHAGFYEGAKLGAAKLGYRLEHFWLSAPGMSHRRLSKILSTRGIRGVVIASHSRQMEEKLELDWSCLNGVKIDYFPHQPMLPSVSNDQCSIVRLAVRKAREAGAQRIGLVMHRGWDLTVDRMWTAGYLVEQALLPPADRLPICYFPDEEPRRAWESQTDVGVKIDPSAFKRWYDRWRPEVIVGSRSFVQESLSTWGLAAPRDVSLLDIFLWKADGETAGVVQNHRRVGETAIEIVDGRLARNSSGIPKVPTLTLVEGEWAEGTSFNLGAKQTRRDRSSRV